MSHTSNARSTLTYTGRIIGSTTLNAELAHSILAGQGFTDISILPSAGIPSGFYLVEATAPLTSGLGLNKLIEKLNSINGIMVSPLIPVPPSVH